MKQTTSPPLSLPPADLPHGRRRSSVGALRYFKRFFWAALLLFVVGCDGCTKDDGPVNQAPPKADRLEAKLPQMRPYEPDSKIAFSKSGHWMQAKQEVKANDGDESMTIVANATNRRIQSLVIEGTNDEVHFRRSISLAKGQTKSPELLIFVPRVPSITDQDEELQRNPSLRVAYQQNSLGVDLLDQNFPTTALRPSQYFFVVVSSSPSRHQFWGGLSALNWPSELRDEFQRIVQNRVASVAEEDAELTLPDSLITWTSVSHLVWYDMSPDRLSEKQKMAIRDWIAFGGVLVLSGPDALAALNDQFFAEISPLTSISARPVDPTLAETLNKHWTVDGEDKVNFATNQDMVSLSGQLADSAQWVENCEGILAEKRFGRGRVVLSTIPLSDDSLVTWKSYGSFVNGAIMRRPARTWDQAQFGGDLRYANANRGKETDPDLSTEVRFLSRDIGLGKGQDPISVSTREESERDRSSSDSQDTLTEPGDVIRVDSFRGSVYPEGEFAGNGAASWNDQSGPAAAASDSLQIASGINVPKVDTIIKLLVAYLCVLVPLNWVFFRLIGRVEWAWIAAPIIAVVGAVVVARSVQLDIGFSRSENRIGLIEIQPEHPRAHQTGYVSLYTSLTTRYAARFRDADGYVLPFTGRSSNRSSRASRRVLDYEYSDSDGDGIVNFPVSSNSTGMLHFESVINLDGTISMDRSELADHKIRIKNGTNLAVRDAAVVGFDEAGVWRSSWIGDFDSGDQTEVMLEPTEVSRWITNWDSDSITRDRESVLTSDGNFATEDSDDGVLPVGIMMRSILYGYDFGFNEYVLIGWAENDSQGDFGPIAITPIATQRTERNVVLAHLTYGPLAVAAPDVKLPQPTTFEE